MSMLVEQIKELREKADMLDNLVPMLREAADTIESLRERLQDETLERGECEIVHLENMGDWNGVPIIEYVFGCGEPHERYVFFFDDTPEPTTCSFCGKAVER